MTTSAQALPEMLCQHVTFVRRRSARPTPVLPSGQATATFSARQPSDRFELGQGRLTIPADERERARLLVSEMYAELRLEQALPFRQQLLLEQDELETHFRPLSFVIRGGTFPSCCQFRKTSRSPHPAFSLSRFCGRRSRFGDCEPPSRRARAARSVGGEGVAGIPEYGLVGVVTYRGFRPLIGIVLVNEQVDERFAVGEVVGRRIVTLERLRSRSGTDVRQTVRTSRSGLSRLRIRFSSSTVRSIQRGPAIGFVTRKREALTIDDRARQQLPKRSIASEQQDGRSGRCSPAISFDKEPHLVEEIQIRQVGVGTIPGLRPS